VGVIIRTGPGNDLWVTGPVNEFKDGIQALSAVIETYGAICLYNELEIHETKSEGKIREGRTILLLLSKRCNY
jgi:hypothetical protein